MSKLDELNPYFRKKVVDFLKDYLSAGRKSFQEAIAANPENWWAQGGWHFGQGMSIRNALRDAGFTDDKLPLIPTNQGEVSYGNWDDYYVEAIEEAMKD